MIRYHAPFDGKRFIGDKSKMIFHDSCYESGPARVGGCRIDHIATKDVKTFDPDGISTAIEEGFAPCPECLRTGQGLHE